MGIDRMILTVISIVLIVFLTVVAIELVIPITKNQAFNEECRTFLLKMEQDGGLDTWNIGELGRRLTEKGLTNVSIFVPFPGQVKFGETMTLSVTASYPFRLGVAGMTLSDRLQQFKYSKSVFCRRIEIG